MNHPTLDLQGHRGCRGLLPENTIPAMRKAIDFGVTTLEMDVVISGDEQVVVSHDPYFHEEITTTPDGKALKADEAAKHRLYALSYNEIRRYDVGLKKHPRFPRQQNMAVHKPLLSDLIADAEAYAAKQGRTVRYNIEIKSTPQGDGNLHPPVDRFAQLVMAVITAGGIAQRTTIQSFDPRALQATKSLSPISLALLIEDDDKRTPAEQLQQLGFVPAIYSPHYSLVNEDLVRFCQSKGLKLIPWTVNDLAEMKKLVALGVDGIISDYPDLFGKLRQ